MPRDFRSIPLGWVPDLPDARDWSYRDKYPLKIMRLPSIVDLRPKFGSVNDQGEIGSCTAQAATDSMEYCEYVESTDRNDYSRLFLYYNSREHKNIDEGAYLRDVFKSMNSTGVSLENLWPYDTSKWADKPIEAAYDDAGSHTAIEYLSVSQNATELKSVLAEGFPITFGMTIYVSFYETGQNGMVPTPTLDETAEGGHAMLIVGYNSTKQVYIVRNSWGDDWGEHGYCYIPSAMVESRNYSDNFWVVKRIGQEVPTERASSCCGVAQSARRKIKAAWDGLKYG